jgi:uncharacterized protein
MTDLTPLLERIATALEQLRPQIFIPCTDLTLADAFIWNAIERSLHPVTLVNHIDLHLLIGIDQSRDTLLQNTTRFANGFAANNTLLWGARGMGKSSLVKSVHSNVNQHLNAQDKPHLKLIEIHREDLETLPQLMSALRGRYERIIIFCDDLSFDTHDTSYKSLKAVLDGGIEGRPDNVLFYATSNRRHLLARDMIENESSTAIHAGEAVEEKVSLSDRFGLWLGFHACSQTDYLAMVMSYAAAYEIDMPLSILNQHALEWSMTRGSRTGRVAWQFICDLAGKMGKSVTYNKRDKI